MKRTRGEKESWEDFEARVEIKQSGGGKKETHNAAPNDIKQIIEIKQTYDLSITRSELRFERPGFLLTTKLLSLLC